MASAIVLSLTSWKSSIRRGVKEFKKMVEKNKIDIPQHITKGLSDEQFNAMIDVSLVMKPLWENALGKDWEKIMTRDRLRGLYEKL